MQTVLITGGAGAIGSNAARLFLRQGLRVIVLDDLSSGYALLLPPGVEFIEGSVTSIESLEGAFSHRPDYVIHLAALFANQNSVENPERDLLVNGMGTLNVLRFAQKSKVQKTVFASSSCVYGRQEVLDEAVEAFSPETPYGITKLLGERYCRFWADHHGLDVVIVRPFNSYGPGEYPGKYRNVIPNFFWRAMRGLPLIITGDGSETRDFTYVLDIVQGITKALFSATKCGDIFNIASGRATDILTLAKMINDLTQNQAGIEFRPPRDWDGVKHRRGVIDKAVKILNYRPETALQTGLEATYRWLQENGEKTSPDLL